MLGDRHKSLIVYSASASAQVKHSTRNSDFLVVFYKSYFTCNKTALAADGSKVLAVGRAGVKSYNTETGDCLRSLPAHKVLVTHTKLLQRNFCSRKELSYQLWKSLQCREPLRVWHALRTAQHLRLAVAITRSIFGRLKAR